MAAINILSLSEAFRASGLAKSMKLRRRLLTIALAFFLAALFLYSGSHFNLPKRLKDILPSDSRPSLSRSAIPHPIHKLVASARDQFAVTTSRQSKTLKEAVKEYRRRYKIPPPPHFDRWYSFAVENNVQLIDEYDGIYHSLLPFWGLSPQTIRKRTGRAIGSEKLLMAVFVRNGTVRKIERGEEWQQKAVGGMLESFIRYLPDMDLAFNLHDEPRVILPNEDLTRLIQRAQRDVIPKMASGKLPRNAWSVRPSDVNDGHVQPLNFTPFNEYAHQFTWTISRLSCPVDTPARLLDYHDHPAPDQLSAYSIGDLGFVYNRTALTDICLSPSLMETFGFFNRPNACSVSHDLIPIFSPSKISSFQDLLYPSPWYWADKVAYNESRDFEWSQKVEKLYWRGTTTSGYSKHGAWRRQHRQRFLLKVNQPGLSKVLEYKDRDDVQASGWHVQEVRKQDFSNLYDVHFTFIGQCDPEDCEEQRNYFEVYNETDFQEAWKSKYLLDIDGNAFSGRFYAFLQSKSLTFKLAIFREWHEDWLKPWAHYIPLSIQGDEYLECLRYFNNEEDGRLQAKQIADDSRSWALRALRHKDMEAWLFRLLLEYGRIIDDDRELLGFQEP